MPARNADAMPHLERIAILAYRIAKGEAITTATIRRDYGVSRATAKRDLRALDRVLRGRVLPYETGNIPARSVFMGGRRAVSLMSNAD